MFFNACEAARARETRLAGVTTAPGASLQQRRRGDARRRVANFIGTHWPVGDDSALGFATHLYASLADGAIARRGHCSARGVHPIGGTIDWADYVHYGNPRFVLVRERRGSAAAVNRQGDAARARACLPGHLTSNHRPGTLGIIGTESPVTHFQVADRPRIVPARHPD